MNKFQKIISIVEAKRGIRHQDILGKTRLAPVVDARYEVAFIARNQLGYTLPRIGRALGRDHTSVLNGLRRIDRKMQDKDYCWQVLEIEAEAKKAIQ